MKFNTPVVLVILYLVLIITGCNEKRNQQIPEVSHIELSLEVQRLDTELLSLPDKSSIAAFLKKYPVFSQEFLQIDQYPNDTVVVNFLYDFLKNPGRDTLQQEVQQVFGDFFELTQSFSEAFRYIKHYFPDFEPPTIQTAVTGFAGSDLFVSDSLIIIGLDYYLGDAATYRPAGIPGYILKRYSKEYIVPATVLLLSGRYNQTNYDDNSMLADMIYYGKAYYFSQLVLPETPDTLLIGYAAKELEDVQSNEGIIWSHFVENRLLYETSHFTKQQYMDERPAVQEIGPKCPGRIGVWLGWEIVRRFAEVYPEIQLPELMGKDNAQEIFSQSRYKPQTPS